MLTHFKSDDLLRLLDIKVSTDPRSNKYSNIFTHNIFLYIVGRRLYIEFKVIYLGFHFWRHRLFFNSLRNMKVTLTKYNFYDLKTINLLSLSNAHKCLIETICENLERFENSSLDAIISLTNITVKKKSQITHKLNKPCNSVKKKLFRTITSTHLLRNKLQISKKLYIGHL